MGMPGEMYEKVKANASIDWTIKESMSGSKRRQIQFQIRL